MSLTIGALYSRENVLRTAKMIDGDWDTGHVVSCDLDRVYIWKAATQLSGKRMFKLLDIRILDTDTIEIDLRGILSELTGRRYQNSYQSALS